MKSTGRYSKASAVALLSLLISVPLAGAGTVGAEFYNFLEKFHGHTCAGSLMGARLGLAAKAALTAAGGEGKLKAKYFSHSCPVDGVQVAAGTTYGNRALEVEERKEQRLLLMAETNGRIVEARLTKLAEENGKKARELTTKARTLPAGSPQRGQLEKEADSILAWFRNAPDKDVVVTRKVK